MGRHEEQFAQIHHREMPAASGWIAAASISIIILGWVTGVVWFAVLLYQL